MALLLFYVVIICWKAGGFHYSSAMIFILVGGLNFLSIAGLLESFYEKGYDDLGTYIALTCLLYTAVVYPIFYKTNITLKHCYALIAIIWLLSTGASVSFRMEVS